MNIVIANRRYFESTGPERYLFQITERLEKDRHHVFPFSVKWKMNKKSSYDSYFVSPPFDEESLYLKDFVDKMSLFQSIWSFKEK